jgi:hypothetical protein
MCPILIEAARFATGSSGIRSRGADHESICTLQSTALSEHGKRVKIVIYGLSRSGTSALFYKVRNSLPPGTISLFEPASYGLRDQLKERLRALLRGRLMPDVLAKVLPCDPTPVRIGDFDDFDRQVLIVRDPRDRLVSDLLYRSYHASFGCADEDAMHLLKLLRRKEAEPLSVPLLRLIEAVEARQSGAASLPRWISAYREQTVTLPLAFHDRRPGLSIFRYEQMVDGQFGTLEGLLGLALGGSATVPPSLQRVVRTKGYGNWRHWFTPCDLEVLRPVIQPFLDRYYPAADWDLAPSPQLDPAFGSDYVKRLIDEQRTSSGLPPLVEMP